MKFSLSYTDYHPFGMVIEGRSADAGDQYRYGFNGQEEEKEISGNESHTSAEYWMYDSRLGRRWNLDPVVNNSQSMYASFRNNPIAYIDPKGNTDYYNNRGKYIGTDGIDNGEKRMALSKSTAKIIKKATKDGSTISMNEHVYKDIVQIPSDFTLRVMTNMYRNTNKSGLEHGLVVSEGAKGEEHLYASKGRLPTPEERARNVGGVVNQNKMRARAIEEGNQIRYDIHTHPEAPAGWRGDFPSKQDIKNRGGCEQTLGYDLPSIIISEDHETGRKTLFFYDSSSNQNSTPNDETDDFRVRADFRKFKRAARRANRDQKKRHPTL